MRKAERKPSKPQCQRRSTFLSLFLHVKNLRAYLPFLSSLPRIHLHSPLRNYLRSEPRRPSLSLSLSVLLSINPQRETSRRESLIERTHSPRLAFLSIQSHVGQRQKTIRMNRHPGKLTPSTSNASSPGRSVPLMFLGFLFDLRSRCRSYLQRRRSRQREKEMMMMAKNNTSCKAPTIQISEPSVFRVSASATSDREREEIEILQTYPRQRKEKERNGRQRKRIQASTTNSMQRLNDESLDRRLHRVFLNKESIRRCMHACRWIVSSLR